MDEFDMVAEGVLFPHLNQADPNEDEGSEEAFDDERDYEDCYPYNSHDLSDDAEALASAGFGTDEDYGDYGGDDY